MKRSLNAGTSGGAKRSRPGPLYRYFDITPEQFISFLDEASKGSWVWDHLRVRGEGNRAARQAEFQLVGVVSGYVPRRLNRRSGQDYYDQRQLKSLSTGEWLKSLPTVAVTSLNSFGG